MINWAGRASMWGVGGTLASMDHFTISAKQLPNVSLLNTCQHLSDLLLVLNNQFAGPRTKQKEKQHKAKMCRGSGWSLKI